MKIFFDYQIFYDQEFGGPSRYFFNLAKKLIKNQNLKICSPIYINSYLDQIPKENIFGIKINYKYIKYLPFKIKIFNNLIFEPLNRNVSNYYLDKFNPDILHQTYYYKFQKKKRPTVLTVFDLIHEKFHKQYFKSETYRPKKLALENADKIICISKNTANDLKKYYDVNENKIEIIHLANSLNEGQPKNALNIDLKKNYLLFVGKRNGYKNFYNFINAYAISKNLYENFSIICFGDQNFTKDEIQQFKKLNLDLKKIKHITGDDNTLVALYNNSKALIYPSLYEGFGLPILESMSLGCPVICSETSSIPEVGGDAAQYFNPEDIENMSQIIENTVFDDVKIKSLITKGKKQAEKFSWNKCFNETMEIYKKLL